MVPNAPKQYETHQNVNLGSNGGGSGVFVAKNSDATSWHELLHWFGPFCTEFRMATKRPRMHTNCTKHPKTSVSGSMGWIGCVRCEKFRRDFVA